MFAATRMARPFWGEANVIMDSQMHGLAASGEFSQPAVYAQPFPFTFPVLRRDIDMNQAAPFDEPVSIPRCQPIYSPPIEEPPFVPPTRDDSHVVTSQPRKKQKEKEPRRRKDRKTTSTVRKTSSRNAPSPDESSASPGRIDGTMDGDDSDGDDGGAGDGGRGRNEGRKAANLPLMFEDEHLTILDSFMKDKPGQNPASIADSSVLPESNVDDSDDPTGREAQLNGKWKKHVGENTKFLVDGMRDTMRELSEVMTKLESDRLGVEKEIEHTRMTEQTRNCVKICAVLRMLAGAMATM
ncbi:hypothetical protein R1sor_012826 [Riccia sorocarpa]|uniref:Uncharacterized protein n=1 Tax=Riccia sorocarpa TaxID=122646 RepID=A0ABD3I8N1_9MARC